MIRRALLALGAVGIACFVAVALVLAMGVPRYNQTFDTEGQYSKNFDFIAYHDLDGRPAFKMAMQVVNGRWYLYLAHFWDRGWSILDVTDPENPKLVRFVKGPDNTMTLQIQVADGLMVTALERPITALLKYVPWDGFSWLLWNALTDGPLVKPWASFEEGVWLWDVSDPTRPIRVGAWESGATGTHRNFYSGGRYAYLAAHRPGFRGHQLVVLDVFDRPPAEVAHWALPEQDLTSGITPERQGYYHHGPAHVEGNRAYVPYGVGGAYILDVTDPSNPTEIGHFNTDASLGSEQGIHTFLPISSRRLAVINSEAHAESCKPDPGRPYAAILDISNEQHPELLSFFPDPKPPEGAGYRDFCDRPGRAGPHNQHHHNGESALYKSDTLVYMTYFNAGLRLFDISDARAPR